MDKVEENIKTLRQNADPRNVAGMARFGISPKGTLGVSMPFLRRLAKGIGCDHELAEGLWLSGIHEARILAGLVDVPSEVTTHQMDAWAKDFDSWDVCDQVCSNLFDRTPYAYAKAEEWSRREEEFVKRAGFVLMAALAVHDKRADDGKFRAFFPIIAREAEDGRNFVKKAVNWALRQLGKRNAALRTDALKLAKDLKARESKTARWIGSDAWRELDKR